MEAALHWEAEGAERLHVVDLSHTGDENIAVMKDCQAVKIPIQVGGEYVRYGRQLICGP